MARVSYVLHAAALKQVPSCVFFPLQAVQTNVLGSSNVIEAAHRAKVRTVVCLSTDKAVYPINAMGMSKALMEKTAQAFSRSRPDSATCLPGPIWQRDVLPGIGDPALRASTDRRRRSYRHGRFNDALHDDPGPIGGLGRAAFIHACPGELFIRKTPAATVERLVTALGSLFGVTPGIRTIGVRHGEKLHETLAAREELSRSTETADYFRIVLDTRGLDYSVYFDEGNPSPRPRPPTMTRPPLINWTCDSSRTSY